ncbi:unnamed protein product [Laminaria digitata]
MAEAEAVLVISQVMGLFGFESFCGPWYLRLGNVKMSQAILELCQVTQEARPTVASLLGKLTRGSISPAKAMSEAESAGVLSSEALVNLRPFLHGVGKDEDPFEALARLEKLVQRIPAVRSVGGTGAGGGGSSRRLELSRKEAVRTKRSLRAFREAWDALLALTTGLARLGIIPPSPLDETDEANQNQNISIGTSQSSAAAPVGGKSTKGSVKKRHRQR